MTKKKEITIYDLAEELHLSASTVSRALKDHYSIGKKTKDAVKKLALQKDYRPNTLAASLRSNKTNTIGVIIPLINRPFISSMISGIEMAAKKAGYNVIISQSHDEYANEVANAEALYASRVTGLVVSLGMETQNYDHLRQFTQHNIPLVFVDRVTRELNTDLVVVDNAMAGFEATNHLIEQGCKRIAHIAGAQHRNIYKERLDGYVDALKKHKIAIDDSLIIHTKYLSPEEGDKCAEKLLQLDNPPDGIFCANDSTAISVIQYAKKHGIKIPDDLAVIGFNNDPLSEIIDPPLSTIAHPAVDMGRLAAQQVLKQKELSDIVRSETIVLKTTLIVRESSLRKPVK
jgi:DNA-binding LacI/PurR family transcriptional regulator